MACLSSWRRNTWLWIGEVHPTMDILMPQLGETVVEGTVVAWHKLEGDVVKTDDILLEIETEKAVAEVPAPTAGILARILVASGQTVAVGTRLAVIDSSESRAASAPGSVTSPAPPPERRTEAHRDGKWRREPKVSATGQPLSPAVRQLLREQAIDAANIQGSGRDGRIRARDVLQHRPSAGEANARPGSTLVPFNRLRKHTAEHMLRSVATSPHVLQAIEVDFTAVVAVRRQHAEEWRARHGGSLTFLPFVACAICGALREYPALNASIEGQALRLHQDVNLAIAVDLNFSGLVAPVLPRAQAMTLSEMASAIQAMAARVKAGTFMADELKGGTYTLSNSGSYGTLITAPIINQPQVAILSMDGIHKRATVLESAAGDAIAIRSMGVLAQSFDHRAVDGAYSAAYLRTLKQIIEERDWSADLLAPRTTA